MRAGQQEGYDADLVNLPERNTAARAARPSIEPPPNSAGPLLAATLPYPSRTLNGTGNGNDDGDKGGAGSDDPQRLPSTRRADRLGVRHYSSSAARPDHSRSKSERNTGPHGGRRRESGRKHQQQRRKKLAWWERPRFLVIALVLIVAIGLSQANKNKRNDNNDGGNNSNGGINPPSRSGEAGGVPVSVSANDVVPMALPTTAETVAADDEKEVILGGRSVHAAY
ncbi:hypothetical protein B0A53_02671 [Rhodotorula sp. CCFEE 5036]|nr:hypothetical protein B0A53_02671 [Rhodotorula sp. CCFEE 5036]